MKKRIISALCAAIVMIAALSVSAFALTIEEQMAANSAAWHIANAAGDTETCEKLHEANVELSKLLAGGSGSTTFNAASGTWEITTSSGSTVNSSATKNNKTDTVTYSTTTSSGSVSTASSTSYSDSSISAFKNAGGTNTNLQKGYNNAAAAVSSSGDYGTENAKTTAAAEAAVVKALLGLSDAQATQLQAALEANKQQYERAQNAYNDAVASGNTSAAESAIRQMESVHEATQAIRADYGYTGDATSYTDGGYYTPSAGGAGGGRDDPKPAIPDSGTGGYITFSQIYHITASCGSGGTISPAGDVTVAKGGEKTFTIKPDWGNEIADILIDGVSHMSEYDGIAKQAGSSYYYTFTNVEGDHTIHVTFKKGVYTITCRVEDDWGGWVYPELVKAEFGSSVSITIQPDDYCKIFSVRINDNYNLELDDDDVWGMIYDYDYVWADRDILVSFTDIDYYQIITSHNAGGTITPMDGSYYNRADGYWYDYDTEIPEREGSDSYRFIPNEGYHIENVIIDSVNMGAITSFAGFNPVTENHRIRVTFAENKKTEPAGSVDAGDMTVTDSLDTDLGGRSIKSGYGIKVSVPASFENVTGLSATLSYNFGQSSKTVTLERDGESFVLPVNPASPTGARCIYIPVETADGTYTLTVTVTAKNVAGGTVSDTATATVKVLGSMYEDDFTGDS